LIAARPNGQSLAPESLLAGVSRRKEVEGGAPHWLRRPRTRGIQGLRQLTSSDSTPNRCVYIARKVCTNCLIGRRREKLEVIATCPGPRFHVLVRSTPLLRISPRTSDGSPIIGLFRGNGSQPLDVGQGTGQTSSIGPGRGLVSGPPEARRLSMCYGLCHQGHTSNAAEASGSTNRLVHVPILVSAEKKAFGKYPCH
jgi:hypothetical protein